MALVFTYYQIKCEGAQKELEAEKDPSSFFTFLLWFAFSPYNMEQALDINIRKDLDITRDVLHLDANY